MAESLLPSKGDGPIVNKAPRPAPEVDDTEEVADVELVSLDEVDDGADDDETAGIEDVDLGEDVGGDDDVEDVFLEEEEDDGNVSGIIGGAKDDEEGN